MAVTLLSITAKGLNTPFNRSMLWKEARKSHVCVQETHFNKTSPTIIGNRNFPHIYLSHSDKKRAGVMIAVKNTVQFHLLQSYVDPSGRYIILICNLDNVTCTLFKTYVPNSCQVTANKQILEETQKGAKRRLVWCGGFNEISDKTMDSTSKSLRPPLQLQP